MGMSACKGPSLLAHAEHGAPPSASCCRDLQQLYNQLVMAGVLTEDEFWKGRQGMLKQRMQGGSAPKQLKGYQNAMVSEQALSNGSSTVSCTSLLRCSLHTLAE